MCLPPAHDLHPEWPSPITYHICTPIAILHCTVVSSSAILPCTCSAPQIFSYTVQDQHISTLCTRFASQMSCPALSAPWVPFSPVQCLHLIFFSPCSAPDYQSYCPPHCKRPHTEYPLVLHQTCIPFALLNYTKSAHKYPLICTRSAHRLPSFPALGLHPELQSTGRLNTICFDAPGGPASGASLRKERLNKLKYF